MIKIRNFSFLLVGLLVFTFCGSNKEFEKTESSFKDGSPKVVKFYADKEFTKLIREVQYYPSGQKRIEGSYKNGEREGLWQAWYTDGTIWSEGEYKNGIENGIRKTYHPNGQVFYEGTMDNGERAGSWKFFKENGELEKEVNYD